MGYIIDDISLSWGGMDNTWTVDLVNSPVIILSEQKVIFHNEYWK